VPVLSSYDIFIGIDPGLDGALAAIGNSGLPRVWKAPTLTVGGKRQLVVPEMVGLVVGAYSNNRTIAILENVHSMPKQGVTSSFTFGRGFGLWEGILAALGIPYMLVSPKTWKAAVLRDTPQDKGAAIMVALQFWPHLGRLPDGKAEALLIAEYGRRLHLG